MKPGFLTSEKKSFAPLASAQHPGGSLKVARPQRGRVLTLLPSFSPSTSSKFPNRLSTPNTHLPSGVTAHVSGVHILSWAHLSRCDPPSALFRDPRDGRKPSDAPASTARLCSCLTSHVGHELTSLSFHFPFFCQLATIIRPSSWGQGDGERGVLPCLLTQKSSLAECKKDPVVLSYAMQLPAFWLSNNHTQPLGPDIAGELKGKVKPSSLSGSGQANILHTRPHPGLFSPPLLMVLEKQAQSWHSGPSGHGPPCLRLHDGRPATNWLWNPWSITPPLYELLPGSFHPFHPLISLPALFTFAPEALGTVSQNLPTAHCILVILLLLRATPMWVLGICTCSSFCQGHLLLPPRKIILPIKPKSDITSSEKPPRILPCRVHCPQLCSKGTRERGPSPPLSTLSTPQPHLFDQVPLDWTLVTATILVPSGASALGQLAWGGPALVVKAIWMDAKFMQRAESPLLFVPWLICTWQQTSFLQMEEG